jgi:hypothetical protein
MRDLAILGFRIRFDWTALEGAGRGVVEGRGEIGMDVVAVDGGVEVLEDNEEEDEDDDDDDDDCRTRFVAGSN